MNCPKCKSNKVLIQQIEAGNTTKTHKANALDGGLRLTGALMTGGLSLLLPKKKANSKTKTQYRKVATCQECGEDWNL